ncbi:hypothetical protein PHYPSEUDO_014402 [Phytophthora pseudosyringae]|uniref:GxxExxY protein n=1 Tax=Phytophthora pseudosyringae TaxID=221518 RepID=A0A8T1V562_9STRA|nr:hypothetical protein PHYPSEUDO_014402 [Phytophthora pseudosyringae]
MNTRSKTREQDEASFATASDILPPSEDRGNNQEEHERDAETNTRDAVVELAENLHKISFGEAKRDSSTEDLARITSSSQLKEELPAICNEVFCVLGPYNLEATYKGALARELKDRGVTVFSEEKIPLEYKGQQIATRRVDLYLKLDKPVILELKAVVGSLTSEHMKQLKFYMTHFNVSEGYLINFPHISGFPDGDNVPYVEHALQGNGVSDRVTRSKTTRKSEMTNIIHVETAKKMTVKKSTITKTTNVKGLKVKRA